MQRVLVVRVNMIFLQATCNDALLQRALQGLQLPHGLHVHKPFPCMHCIHFINDRQRTNMSTNRICAHSKLFGGCNICSVSVGSFPSGRCIVNNAEIAHR